jgi:predicted TIM-barrel fold metal-dependent hydrolase
MELIDTHVHLLAPEHFTYAWCQSVPALDRAFRLGDYRMAAAQAPAGMQVRSAVFMEADVPRAQQEAETAFFSSLAGRDRGALPVTALIAGAWPESADFPARLEQLVADGLVRGVRRVLHTQPAGFALTPQWTENLRRLPSHGFTFDLCLRPPLLPDATELVTRCPETWFVLDHCGGPNLAAGELDPWRDAVQQLAARPNVVCKFSGLAGLADPIRPLTPQVRPWFEHCLGVFGADRMMWGSDWPLCDLTFDLAAWLQTTAELLGELSEGERTAIARGTARRVYRL